MTIDLATVELKKGAHSAGSGEACLMEWVSIFAGLPFTDHPACTDPVVAAYARSLNDVMPDDQRQRLVPYIPRLAATKNGCPPGKRAFLCADRAVRVFAPMALRAAGRNEDADRLAGLPEIVNAETASAASRSAAEAARSVASRSAAEAARSVAARSAAEAAWAARSAWDEAAWAAARSAAAWAEAARSAAAAAEAARSAWDEALRLLDDLIALGAND